MKHNLGHVSAIITIVIWGTTFISTKVLLTTFQPIEILFLRFVIGFVALLLIYPRRMRTKGIHEEFLFAMAGLCGICLYYLLENIALTYTYASNVGVIISIAPFFTAIVSQVVLKEKHLNQRFLLGFIVAMLGICLISFQGASLHVNPLGDLLAIGASLVWAIYALLSRRLQELGYATIPATRRMFFYGLVWMLPTLFVFDVSFTAAKFTNMTTIGNLLFLGLGASALCFVTWNYSVKVLGALRTSVYIYMVPVITILTSVIILQEPITWISLLGTLFILFGLFLSERSSHASIQKTRSE